MVSRQLQQGFGLVNVLVSISLLSGLMFLGMNASSGLFRSSAKLKTDVGLQGARKFILEGASCSRTFPDPAPPAVAPTPPCGDGDLVALRRGDGQVMVQIPRGPGARAGSVSASYTEFGAAPAPRLQLRAVCRANGIDVEAQVVSGPAESPSVLKDEVTGQFRGFPRGRSVGSTGAHPLSYVAGGPASEGLCAQDFRAPRGFDVCTGNTYFAGGDFASRSIMCRPVPTCGPDESLRMNNGAFSCLNARTIAATEVNAVRNELLPRIQRMESEVRNLQSQVTTLQSTFSALSQRIPAGDIRLIGLQQQINNAQQEVNVLNAETSTLRQRVETVGLGPIVRLVESSNNACQLYRNMKCPDGYIANAYEARVPGSSTHVNCSIQCRRLLL